MTTIHTRQLQQYTRPTNNNYTQDNLKLAMNNDNNILRVTQHIWESFTIFISSVLKIQNQIKNSVTARGPFLKYDFHCTNFPRHSKFPILLCGKQLYRILPKSVKNNGLCGQIFMYVCKYSISMSPSLFSRNSWLFDND